MPEGLVQHGVALPTPLEGMNHAFSNSRPAPPFGLQRHPSNESEVWGGMGQASPLPSSSGSGASGFKPAWGGVVDDEAMPQWADTQPESSNLTSQWAPPAPRANVAPPEPAIAGNENKLAMKALMEAELRAQAAKEVAL